MHPAMNDLELLALEAATCFVLTDAERIVRTNAPDNEAPPRTDRRRDGPDDAAGVPRARVRGGGDGGLGGAAGVAGAGPLLQHEPNERLLPACRAAARAALRRRQFRDQVIVSGAPDIRGARLDSHESIYENLHDGG